MIKRIEKYKDYLGIEHNIPVETVELIEIHYLLWFI